MAGLIDSDGHISSGTNGNCICHYTSVNKLLLKDLCRMLCSLGISHQYRDLRVHIWNTKLLEEIISNYLVVRKFVGKRTAGKHCSFIPKREIKNLITQSKLSERAFCKKHGINRRNIRLKTNYCTTDLAERVGISTGDLIYSPVVNIEDVDDQQFYGMSVRHNHNLIANGIVAKNCYQEQMMRVFVEMANLTESYGYKFQKTCAKKDKDVAFIEECKKLFKRM